MSANKKFRTNKTKEESHPVGKNKACVRAVRGKTNSYHHPRRSKVGVDKAGRTL